LHHYAQTKFVAVRLLQGQRVWRSAVAISTNSAAGEADAG
jgi:hypothetical protein